MNELAERLTSEFADKEYAHAYVESHAISRIAAQVHVLRKQRRWSQQKLAELSGIAQERISKIENGDFTSLTMSSLNKLARAFDVDVRVAFEAFSAGILDVINLSKEKLEVLPREEDLASLDDRTLRIGHDGQWTVVDPRKLASVVNFPSKEPAAPSAEWTRISATGR